MSLMAAETLTPEREGLNLAKSFIEYFFSLEMLTLDHPRELIKDLKTYALKICDDCGTLHWNGMLKFR